MRLAAPDNRVGHVKDEEDTAQAAQSMADATPAKAVQAHTASENKLEADAADTAMPQAQVSDPELVSGGTNPQDPEMVASVADVRKINHEQPAMSAPVHKQVDPVDAASTLEQPCEAFSGTKQGAANLPILTAAATLKRSETFAEEDDYDADD